MIGRVVGNYKILQALGEGGVGMVYKGVDTMLDREVAIKVLRPELASQTAVVERFRSEAVTLAKLSHPNIAMLYSLFRDGQDLIMVLEFIKGETLDQTLYQRGKIPTDEAIPVFCQALEGINYAHNLGIVHRDIKPGNMMLTVDGVLKVLDFGIARLLGSNRMTRIGNVIGTLEYMSPEQVKGLETDARSDVYGLGIMLYEMLTGKLPFESENDFVLMKMQTENMPISPRQLNPDIPEEVENAIMKSVAKDPNLRFQSAGDFLDYFLEIGFALPNNTFGFGTMYGRKNSRPSKPGIQSGEVSTALEVEVENFQPTTSNSHPIPIPTAPISKTEIQVTLEVGEELKKAKIAETRLGAEQSEIKGTRLAAPVIPLRHELKATRLGEAQINPTRINNGEASSFFSKLNWMHYTGAGVIGLFALTIVATAAVLPFVWGGEEKPKVEQKSPTNPTETPALSIQPIAQEESTKEPNQEGGGTSQINAQKNSEIETTPGTAITPVPTDPKSPPEQTSPRQIEKQKDTVKNSPPSAPKQQKPIQTAPPVQKPRNGGSPSKPTKPPAGDDKNKLRDILTGRRGDS